MRIRIAESKDAQQVYLLMNQLEETILDPDYFMHVFSRQCRDERYSCLVAEEEDHIIAICNTVIRHQIHQSFPITEIEEFVVDEKYRGKGIGHQMKRKAMEIAKESGCRKIIVSTNTKRIRAHHFYEKEGMEMTHFLYEEEL